MFTDEEFQKRYRFDKNTVIFINEIISPDLAPVSNRKCTLSVLEQLFITLRFYATGTFQIVVGDDINVHKTTVSRVVFKVSKEIAKLARNYIAMPTSRELREVKAHFYSLAGFPNVIGCVDGTHIPIQSCGGDEAELFRNRKGYFSINVQVVCDANLLIRDIDARWHGSAHDSTVYHNSFLRARLDNNEIDGHLLGDSAYPCGRYMMTPILNTSTNAERLYNVAQIKTRNTIERTFGVWKRRFPCLSQKLRIKLEHTLAVIIATAVLHNIAIQQNDTVSIDNSPEDIISAESNMQPLTSEGNHYRRLLLEQYFM
ncbi:Putative nuclease HARBI1 [Eumeta japonica]|uniref:Putative nuclease HARBI1 n=1 Tax=Eumeta variegata TaxID=151549 RepID=A0A4C1VC78_EUMVA|nr:Putative nuclease HARBI1 [Eumeta japonica]